MMSSKPLWREPAGASTESVSVRSIESLNTPGPRRRFDAPSSSRWAPPSGRSVAFSIPESFSGGRGGKCFSRAISSFSVWFSTRSPTKAAPSFSFCALNRSTSPSNRRTKPTSSVGVIRSSESLAPGDIPGLNQAFVNAPLPPGNLPRLPKKAPNPLKTASRTQNGTLPAERFRRRPFRRRVPSTRQQFPEALPPRRRVIGRGAELGPPGAAAGGEVEALAVEADRAPAPGTWSPGGAFVSGEPRDCGVAERVDRGDEPLLGLRQRVLAGARGKHVSGLERAGAAEPAIEMHALDSQPEHAEIGKPRIQSRLPIALQIPRLGAARRFEIDPPAKRDAGMVQRVAAVAGAGQQERGARIASQVPGVARQRRHQEQRRAVEIAGDADQCGQGTAALRLQRRQRAGSGEPHQSFGVGDRLGMGLVRIGRGVRHGGLETRSGSRQQEARSVERVKGAVRRPGRQPRSYRWPIYPTSW